MQREAKETNVQMALVVKVECPVAVCHSAGYALDSYTSNEELSPHYLWRFCCNMTLLALCSHLKRLLSSRVRRVLYFLSNYGN